MQSGARPPAWGDPGRETPVCAGVQFYRYTHSQLPVEAVWITAPTCAGEPLEAYIFMGPVYYQKLKHMVLDKVRLTGVCADIAQLYWPLTRRAACCTVCTQASNMPLLATCTPLVRHMVMGLGLRLGLPCAVSTLSQA